MGFARTPSVEFRRSSRSAVSIWCLRFCAMMLRLVFGMLLIGALASAVVYFRLSQGPIALPGIASLVVDRVNSASSDANLEVGDLVLSLGDGVVPSGLQFVDVSVRGPNGDALFHAPRITASFLARDVLIGQVQPIQITLIEPAIEVVRNQTGNFSFGMAQPEAERAEDISDEASEADRFDALANVIDAFVGDTSEYPQLQKLERIQVLRADLTYFDQDAGRKWRAQDIGVEISKHDRGARGVLTLDEIDGATSGLSLRILADRLRGTGETLMTLQFGRVAAKVLADQAPGLDWLELIDGRIEGRASAVLEKSGAVRDLSGVLVTENGALDLNGERFPYDFARLSFAVDPNGQTVEVRDFTATSDRVGVRLNAVSELSFDQNGEFAGMFVDAEMDRLSLALPDIFERNLEFDAAGLTAHWERATNEINIASADLRAEDTTYHLSGRMLGGETEWLGDLRVTAEQTSISEVLRIWPVDAAVAARTWIDDNIVRADVPEMLLNLGFGAGAPNLAMDFRFSDLETRYLQKMSPLRGVEGIGHLTLESLDLQIDEGYVQPGRSGRIALGGSQVQLTDFSADQPLAEIQITASGDVQDVLTLIDQKPLQLIRKLDADLGKVAGRAEVDVALNFPLIEALELTGIDVIADAKLSDLALKYALPRLGTLNISADTANLRANIAEMSIDGQVKLDGVPSTVAWTEFYGEQRAGRTLSLESTASNDLLQRIGIEPSFIDGEVPFDLELSQNSGGPLVLEIDADLNDATVAIQDLAWRKEPERRGQLSVDLSIEKRTTIDRFRLDTSDLTLAGSVQLGAKEEFKSASLTRLALQDTFDLSAEVQRTSPDTFAAQLSGRFLDVIALQDRQGEDADEGEASGPEIAATYDIERLVAGKNIRLSDARGTYNRGPSGASSANLSARLAGFAPISVAYTRPKTGAGQILIEGANAGNVLRALDLYDDGNGGKLNVTAEIDDNADLSGVLRIEDLSVGSDTTFQQVLRGGGFDGEETVVESGGLSFRKIWIPFVMANDTITLTDAIASSSALALKVNGSVDQNSDDLNLRGVISPAYGLTGALDNVPLLGTLLSGGEGEGILAMTFTLTGPSKDPDFALNPLSLLTPGILRNVFKGSSSGNAETFREGIQQPDR